MKKILPLIALVFLFATACKKENPEPETAPVPVVSAIVQIMQSYDGKTVLVQSESYRQSGYDYTVFYGDNNTPDSTYQSPMQDNYSVIPYSPSTDLGKIKYLSSNQVTPILFNNEYYYLLDTANNSDYIIFGAPTEVFFQTPSFDTTTIPAKTNLNSLTYALDYMNNIAAADTQQYFHFYDNNVQIEGFNFLCLPKNATAPVLYFNGAYKYYWQPGTPDDYSNWTAAQISASGYPASHFNKYESEQQIFTFWSTVKRGIVVQ